MKIMHGSNSGDTLIMEPGDILHPLKSLSAKLIVKKFGNKPQHNSVPWIHTADEIWVEDYDEWIKRMLDIFNGIVY